MTFTMTFNDGDFLEQIENIKRDESLCLITNKEKAFISKENTASQILTKKTVMKSLSMRSHSKHLISRQNQTAQ